VFRKRYSFRGFQLSCKQLNCIDLKLFGKTNLPPCEERASSLRQQWLETIYHHLICVAILLLDRFQSMLTAVNYWLNMVYHLIFIFLTFKRSWNSSSIHENFVVFWVMLMRPKWRLVFRSFVLFLLTLFRNKNKWDNLQILLEVNLGGYICNILTWNDAEILVCSLIEFLMLSEYKRSLFVLSIQLISRPHNPEFIHPTFESFRLSHQLNSFYFCK